MSIHRKTYPDTRRYTAIVKEIAQNKYNRIEAEDRRVKAESEKQLLQNHCQKKWYTKML